MRYTIVINLNYGSNPHKEIYNLFETIRNNLLHAGFTQSERRFSVNLPAAAACVSARQAIGLALKRHGFEDQPTKYINEFYGFDQSKCINLLTPSIDGIDVEELTTDMLDELINTEAG